MNNPDDCNLAIALLLTTGLRIGELCALTINDVDLEKHFILINKMERHPTHEIVSCKDYSDRIVFLNDDATAIMRMVIDGKTGELFNNPRTGERYHVNAISDRLARIQSKKLRFTNKAIRSPHDCRRTYASLQYIHGVDIMTIQAQLDHKNVQQTWDYIKDIVEANDRLNRLECGNLQGLAVNAFN